MNPCVSWYISIAQGVQACRQWANVGLHSAGDLEGPVTLPARPPAPPPQAARRQEAERAKAYSEAKVTARKAKQDRFHAAKRAEASKRAAYEAEQAARKAAAAPAYPQCQPSRQGRQYYLVQCRSADSSDSLDGSRSRPNVHFPRRLLPLPLHCSHVHPRSRGW